MFGVIKTVLGLVWCFFIIDHFGRRNIVRVSLSSDLPPRLDSPDACATRLLDLQLLVGATGGALSMLAIAIYIKVDQPQLNPIYSHPMCVRTV